MTENDRGRKRRIAAATATVLAAVMVFAALGGIGLASGVISAAQYQYGGKKVTICHKGKVTIRVSINALPAHTQHGDDPGMCPALAAAKAKAAKAAKADDGDEAASTTSGHGKGQGKAQGNGSNGKGNGSNGKGNGKK